MFKALNVFIRPALTKAAQPELLFFNFRIIGWVTPPWETWLGILKVILKESWKRTQKRTWRDLNPPTLVWTSSNCYTTTILGCIKCIKPSSCPASLLHGSSWVLNWNRILAKFSRKAMVSNEAKIFKARVCFQWSKTLTCDSEICPTRCPAGVDLPKFKTNGAKQLWSFQDETFF